MLAWLQQFFFLRAHWHWHTIPNGPNGMVLVTAAKIEREERKKRKKKKASSNRNAIKNCTRQNAFTRLAVKPIECIRFELIIKIYVKKKRSPGSGQHMNKISKLFLFEMQAMWSIYMQNERKNVSRTNDVWLRISIRIDSKMTQHKNRFSSFPFRYSFWIKSTVLCTTRHEIQKNWMETNKSDEFTCKS